MSFFQSLEQQINDCQIVEDEINLARLAALVPDLIDALREAGPPAGLDVLSRAQTVLDEIIADEERDWTHYHPLRLEPPHGPVNLKAHPVHAKGRKSALAPFVVTGLRQALPALSDQLASAMPASAPSCAAALSSEAASSGTDVFSSDSAPCKSALASL